MNQVPRQTQNIYTNKGERACSKRDKEKLQLEIAA